MYHFLYKGTFTGTKEISPTEKRKSPFKTAIRIQILRQKMMRKQGKNTD